MVLIVIIICSFIFIHIIFKAEFLESSFLPKPFMLARDRLTFEKYPREVKKSKDLLDFCTQALKGSQFTTLLYNIIGHHSSSLIIIDHEFQI